MPEAWIRTLLIEIRKRSKRISFRFENGVKRASVIRYLLLSVIIFAGCIPWLVCSYLAALGRIPWVVPLVGTVLYALTALVVWKVIWPRVQKSRVTEDPI